MTLESEMKMSVTLIFWDFRFPPFFEKSFCYQPELIQAKQYRFNEFNSLFLEKFPFKIHLDDPWRSQYRWTGPISWCSYLTPSSFIFKQLAMEGKHLAFRRRIYSSVWCSPTPAFEHPQIIIYCHRVSLHYSFWLSPMKFN